MLSLKVGGMFAGSSDGEPEIAQNTLFLAAAIEAMSLDLR